MAFSKQSVIKYPLARSERLLVENIDDETVIYDEESKAAHALKPLAAAVFSFADGKNSLGDIAELASYRLGAPVTEAQVSEAVAELDGCALLDAPALELEGGVSRRDALKRFGAVGVAAGASTVLISSIAAPAAFAGVAGNGANYVCGTDLDNVTGQNSAKNASFPQVPASSGWEDWIGQSCNTGSIQNYYCVVNGVQYKNVPLSVCESGSFCTNPSLSYVNGVSNQVTCQSSSKAGDPNCSVKQHSNSGTTQYWAVPQALCKTTSAGQFCVDGAGDYIESLTNSSDCESIGGNTWIDLDGFSSATWNQTGNGNGTWVSTSGKMTPTNGSANGIFVGVPCDGSINGSHYQCAEVACVPTAQANSAPFIKNETTFKNTYGQTGPFSSQNYPSKYCSDNNCNNNGRCS